MTPNHEIGEAFAARQLIEMLGRFYGPTPEPELDIWKRIASYIQRTWVLTDAETSTAVQCLKGLSNREIATRRDVGAETVNRQLDVVMRKAGVHTRGQLAARVLEVANLL